MPTKISTSPARNTYQRDSYLKRNQERGLTEKNSQEVRDMIEMYENLKLEVESRERNPEWQKNNLEYDLRTTDWILEKTRKSDSYAQNLYAALCNNEFVKINLENTPDNVVETLKNGYPTWSCSWRYAGGIIADMRQSGDYIDWYCSGIRDTEPPGKEEWASWTEEQKQKFQQTAKYVHEGTVTDEIKQDLNRLGWDSLD